MDDSHKCDAEQRCLCLNLGVGYLGVVTLKIHTGNTLRISVFSCMCIIYLSKKKKKVY